MGLKDFVLLGKLGEGTFATVYKARRLSDQNLYAIKKIQMRTLDEKSKNNALNEIRLLASFNCPNIIKYNQTIYDEKSNTLYLVMEYADEGDLLKYIKQRKKAKKMFFQLEIWKLLISLLHGLDYIHEKSIMHRDIKSENILISGGVFKIGDMNVSKVKKNDLKQTQTGTPYYASPEVWNDLPYDEKSDIWSLGCVLYEMATFRPPFMAANMQQLYEQVCMGKVKAISRNYSQELFEVILSCLKKNPNERPTVQQLLSNWTIQMYENMCFKKEELEILSNSKLCPLLKTINMSKNSIQLKKQLPKPNYSQNNYLQTIVEKQQNTKGIDSKILCEKKQENRQARLQTPESNKRRSLPRTEKSAKKIYSHSNQSSCPPSAQKKEMQKVQSIQEKQQIRNILMAKIPKTQSRQSILREILLHKNMRVKNEKKYNLFTRK